MRGWVNIGPVAHVPPDGSMIDPATARFWATWWEDEDDGDRLEHVELDGAEAAIRWGRDRASIVLIRLGSHVDTYFSAGEVFADDDDGPMVTWPPSGPPPGGWWEPIRAPTLAEIEEVSAEVDSGKRLPKDAAKWAMERLTAAAHEDSPQEVRDGLVRLARLTPLRPQGPPTEIYDEGSDSWTYTQRLVLDGDDSQE